MIGYLAGGALGLAVATTASGDPLGVILGTGVAGAVLVLFIAGLIVPKSVVTQKDEEIHRLQTLFTDEVIPMVKAYTETMTAATHNMAESTEALRTLAEIQRERLMRENP